MEPDGSIPPDRPGLALPDPAGVPVRVVRSRRRTRTSQASLRDGVIEVRVPARLADHQVEEVVRRLAARVRRRVLAPGPSAAELMQRAARLADRYVDGVRPTSITWSDRMQRSFGTCTPVDGTIRIARWAGTFPGYVLDDLLIHELAHLIEPGHGPRFQAIVARNPDHERAEAWMAGYAFGRDVPQAGDGACGVTAG